MTVNQATIRADAFHEIYNLINTNLASGWTLLSSFPNNKPVFPCVVLNPAMISTDLISLDGSLADYNINVELEFFAKTSEGKAKIDEIRDNITNTIISNQASLKTSNLLLPNNPIDDSNIDTIAWDGIDINTGAMIISLQLRKTL